MLETLDILNFRSHTDTHFEFSSGVNAIVGNPDSGKTNCLRSLIWLLTNRPLGFRFHSQFSDDPTMVTAQFSGEESMTLGKTKTKSMYQIGGENLRSIGSDVPEEIQRAANMTELNIQSQLSKPFLICNSSGEVAKTFNRITRLEKPDQAISALTTDINTKNKELKTLEMQKIVIVNEITKLGDVQSMQDDCVKLERTYAIIQMMTNEIDDLARLIGQASECKTTVDSFGDIAKMKTDMEALVKMSDECLELERGCDDLSDAVMDTENASKRETETHEDLVEKAKEYREFLSTISVCPYCSHCSAPISKHNLADVLKGIYV